MEGAFIKKKSVYQSLVTSNFVILLVAIVVAAVSFQGYNRFSSAQAEDYNTVILRQIRETFDEKMNNINKLMLDVSFNSDVSSLSFSGSTLSDLERYRSVQVMKTLDDYAVVYNFIDSIALYYAGSDRIISNSSAYASSDLYLKNADEILDRVILENFINASLTLEVSRCLFFNLMGTAIKVISTLGYSTAEIFGEDSDCSRQITSCNNIQDMEATLRQMFYTICIYINGRKRQGGQMIDQILEHIRQNSADPNLSLGSVASAFGMNSNYLSGYFKEQTGENFLPFLNGVRLEQASGLLRDTPCPWRTSPPRWVIPAAPS